MAALVQRGTLVGHKNWVTAIATTREDPTTVVSSSRDKSLIVWKIVKDAEEYGVMRRRLIGHAHFVSDVVISSDSQFALSSSWDGSLRLWDLTTGEANIRFLGHTKDVLSVAFNSDNSKIVSSSRDKSIRLWNVLGECKYTIESAHSDWVSCVRFSPAGDREMIVSAGWDKVVKVWDLSTLKLRSELAGHTGFLSTVTVSPDGSLCASGGKDGVAMLWDMAEGKCLFTLEAGAAINSLCFSPSRYWLVAATTKGIKIWDLEAKSVVAELNPEFEERSKKALATVCTSIAWSADGTLLYSGYTDNIIRVWEVSHS